MTINLADKKILLIEDNPFMRKSICSMLYTLDIEHVVEASNAGKALAAIRKRSFDIILADYNLGVGKNSLQLLEEVRTLKLLPFKAIFIIISGEQTPQMVLGAMDVKPDEYLTKPFNAHQLSIRLKRNLLLKQLLCPIQQAVDDNNYAQAIHYCDQLLRQKTQHHLILLRKRAELALAIDDLTKAEEIYLQILQRRELPWARLGLGIIAFRAGHIEQAIDLFNSILQKTPLFIECYDWLSQVYQQIDQPEKAEHILSKAVELSPNAILRQKKLGATAYRNQHLEHAENAFKQVIKLGKNSIHKSSGDFAALAKTYNDNNKTHDAFNVLNMLRDEFRHDSEAEIRALLVESEIHLHRKAPKQADDSLNKALNLSQSIEKSLPKELLLELSKTCFLHKKESLALEILSPLIKNHIDDEGFIAEIQHMQKQLDLKGFSDNLIKQTKKELIDLNNRGVALFEQGKIEEALSLFENAFERMPHNQTILLNIIKIQLFKLKTEKNQHNYQKIQNQLRLAQELEIPQQKIGQLQIEINQLQPQHEKYAN
ncbi:tetratricopeptide repeat protein [methane-oxidizing endosymbiont of Gigantopelta aegis]|uniref:tetratricopeptide repeat protein n=1 Tax=methane-oxidizing endosymbiont of Gigantopelta aegis TaxID=2794938 RepID=UPI0018DB740A|nr:tetratricopeptide repeat protein [methane-oxidizing endosymbiont of Gigantopelta aegis]